MKNKITFCLLVAACIEFSLSCNNTDGAITEPLAVTKEKKSKPVKTKKKKESKKTVQAIERKPEPISEPAITTSPVNTTIGSMIINKATDYAAQNGLSTEYCFLIDMNQSSGHNRFFVYSYKKNSIVYSGLVAHGCCNESFIANPRFSNTSGSGCSSLGKYKVGEFYRGQWGKSFRLYGLDKSNSNAYKRAVVIHGHKCIEDKEIYPRVLCNSFGCPMVSFKFFDKLSGIIEKSDKPILLWIYR
ncbi:MAG: hypothetical protein E6H07_07880 [Bacteroidetes bacterium]|nr:MAG: hypothetical protein E6H07_07880 [Bacteroidota bacterium]